MESKPAKDKSSPKEDEEIASINMDLEDKPEPSHDLGDFHNDNPMPNIWALDHEHDSNSSSADTTNQAPQAEQHDDELEKPSFLRRFRKRSNSKPTDEEHQ